MIVIICVLIYKKQFICKYYLKNNLLFFLFIKILYFKVKIYSEDIEYMQFYYLNEDIYMLLVDCLLQQGMVV